MNRPITEFTVSPTDAIRDVMACIDRNVSGIALVVDDQRRLIGTVTDGDLRRALLEGATLDSPVEPYMHRRFTAVAAGTGRAEVLDLMRARSIEQVPVLDAQGKLLALHVLREIIGAVPRPHWAVVMAGGRGERLRPLTDALPKPMVRVAGRPILERIVLHLVGAGIRRIFLSVNYMARMIEDHFGDGTDYGCRIEYLREACPLGTAGSLSLLPEKPQDPLLVLNGDLVTQFDVAAMFAHHCEGSYSATVGIHEYVHDVPYAVVEALEGRVTRISEKPTMRWLVNAGIYLLNPALLDRVPKDTACGVPDLLEQCLDRGEPVGAFFVEDDWLDVGRHHELRKARGETPRT